MALTKKEKLKRIDQIIDVLEQNTKPNFETNFGNGFYICFIYKKKLKYKNRIIEDIPEIKLIKQYNGGIIWLTDCFLTNDQNRQNKIILLELLKQIILN